MNVVARLALGWLLICGAWALANPPLAAPDEGDHYTRTVGIAEGQIVGAPAPQAIVGADAAEIAFDKSTQRAVIVPGALNPQPYNCYLSAPTTSAACLDRPPPGGPPVRLVTSVGTYPPLGLLAAAAVVRAGEDPLSAVRLGRLANLALCLILLVAAAAVLFDRAAGWLSLLGLLITCTPTALFLAASLTPSGLSVSAGVALSAALLRLARPGPPPPRRAWLLAAFGAGALACSHPAGLGWAVILLAAFLVWQGLRRVRGLIAGGGRSARAALTVLAIGVGAAVAWNVAYGPSTRLAVHAFRLALSRVPSQGWNALKQIVAGFGYLEFFAPLLLYLLWFAAVGATVVVAARIADRGSRRALLVATAGAFLVPLAVWILVGRAAGIGIIAREYLPLLVAFPLLAGELVLRERAHLSRRTVRLLASVAPLTGVMQIAAWYVNARRAAVGTAGPLVFIGKAGWTPPAGWLLWIAIVVVGGFLLASLPLPLPRLASARR